MGFLVFILIICFLVVLHELGHFIFARLNGVRIEKFAIGFGPKIFKKKIKETEFIVSLFPLGGYVKLAGDDPETAQGLEDEYLSKSPGIRARIVCAGPLFNYFLAFVFFLVMFISGFSVLIPKVGYILENSAAHHAGLKEGDLVVKIDGEDISEWDVLQETVLDSKGKTLLLTIRREDGLVDIEVTPKKQTIKTLLGSTEDVYMVGIAPSGDVSVKRYSLFKAVIKAGDRLWFFTHITYQALGRMITGALPLRDNIAGPLRIYDITKSAAEAGIPAVLYLMAILNLSLAIFNLLPFPVLDGGHLVFLLIEKIRKKRLAQKTEDIINKVAISALVALFVFVSINDLMFMLK